METLQPKLRFSGFEEDWKRKKIGEVSTITTGSTPSTIVEEYYNGEKLFVSPVDLQGNRYVKNTKTTLTELGFSKGRKISKGSVLFVCIGSTIGKVGIAGQECLTNQQINSISGNSNYYNDFIFSLLEKNASNIRLLAGTQAVPQLNKNDFSNISLPFPSLEEQTKIANFLSSVDEKLNLLKEKKALLEEYKKGMMQKIFSQELRFKDENGKDFVEWEEVLISELTNVIVGGTPSTTKEEYWNGDIPWLSSGELNNGLVTKAKKHITEIGLKNSSAKIMKPNTVMLAMTGATLGKVGFLTFESCGNQSIAGFEPNNKFVSKFFYYNLLFNKNLILSLAGGAAQQGINKASIESMFFSFPSLKEQTKIANFLSAIDQKIELVNTQIEETQQYKKGLLQQMFV